MPFVPVLHAEWIKIRTLRSLLGALAAVLVVTGAFSAVTAARADRSDPLYSVFFGVSLGQVAAVVFGALAVSGEYRGGALRLTLAAAPDRTRWFAAKVVAVALPVLAVGLLTGLATLAVGSATAGLTWAQGLRGVVGCALYLTLMALLAAGLAGVLRSGVGTLGLLIPFLLIVSFVVGDLASGAAGYLPDRAGQLALHSAPEGPLGPWTGLAVTALWAGAALGAGAWCVRRRDA
ncbi:ABC transporter permease [Streptomyces griseoluteus]|uniref:ABC transporter permease n=1 Tax=Streptomyces griseoluteus TaxID=29306 RepID=A0A4Z1DL37_STRGP|nr:ABC transporter permease subunit [Streptomyces griseoluteus]TGN84920.1 ABC transporter permease [Streptomyces griseoluteus]GHF02443.1 ABC transporter [Streptomyces griseoluteus]